jgi:hypothetical protein
MFIMAESGSRAAGSTPQRVRRRHSARSSGGIGSTISSARMPAGGVRNGGGGGATCESGFQLGVLSYLLRMGALGV